MKKIFVLSLFSSLIFAQSTPDGLEINKEFLKSLPPSVQADILDQVDQRQVEMNSEQLSIFSSVLEDSEVKEYVEQELLKRNPEGIKIKPRYLKIDSLKRFGEDYFTGLPTTFMPISEVSPQSDYIVDVGDIFKVKIFGQEEKDLEVQVSRQGSLEIEEVGSLQVSGLTFQQSIELIKNELNKLYVNADVVVTLSEMRDMQILIAGFSKNPGVYTVSGYSNVIHVINVSGGISDQGSFREIDVIRGGIKIAQVDLYEILILGNTSKNLNLRSGDTIRINSRGKDVAIYGGVSKPAIYEISKTEKDINDLIILAGGEIPEAIQNSITISEIDAENLIAVQKDYAFDHLNLKSVFLPFFDNQSSRDEKGISFNGAFKINGLFSKDIGLDILKRQGISSNGFKLAVIAKVSQANGQGLKTTLRAEDLVDFIDNFKTQPDVSIDLYALPNDDIEFLQSREFQIFFNNSLKRNIDYRNCKLYEYLDDKRNEQTYASLQDLFLSRSGSQSAADFLSPTIDKRDPVLGANEIEIFRRPDTKAAICPEFLSLNPEVLSILAANTTFISFNDELTYIPIAKQTNLLKLLEFFGVYPSEDNALLIDIASENQTITLDYRLAANQNVNPGDAIMIRSSEITKSMPRIVYLDGEINNPGKYFISSNETIEELIDRAGGYKDNAFPFGGILLRESAAKIENSYYSNLYREMITSVSSYISRGENISVDGLKYILQELKNIKSSGRVVANFAHNASNVVPTILEHNDKIFIPRRQNTVYVLGEVLNPGTFMFDPSLRARNYIELAGGLSQKSDKDMIIIVSPDGNANRYTSFNPFDQNDIYPGSVIYVSRDLTRLGDLEFVSTLAPVVSSIALSIASLVSINNN